MHGYITRKKFAYFDSFHNLPSNSALTLTATSAANLLTAYYINSSDTTLGVPLFGVPSNFIHQLRKFMSLSLLFPSSILDNTYRIKVCFIYIKVFEPKNCVLIISLDLSRGLLHFSSLLETQNLNNSNTTLKLV